MKTSCSGSTGAGLGFVRGRIAWACISLVVAIAWTGSLQAQSPGPNASSAFPKFYSLKSNPVNLRKGPGTRFPKAWVFRREGLPVEVLREHGRWRQVRDSDGATGWILSTLISSRRTALVSPWQLKETGEAKQLTTLRSRPRPSARAVAMLESGTLVSLKTCDRKWCHVSIGQFRGYVMQERLWGIYPQEVLE